MMLDVPTDIAVIIINYGTHELTIEAVESVLARGHGGRRVAVHLIDNASPGEDARHLAEAHDARDWHAKGVTFWPENENHGFGRGNNVVLQMLADQPDRPRYVFLLNSDATLENETLDILADALDADPEAVAAGAGILDETNSLVTAAFQFPTMAGEVGRTIGIGFVERLLARHRTALPADYPEGPVDWVAGAGVMFRFDALVQIGFFDPIYFLYYEEVDLMHRMTRAGGRVLYVPRARIVHLAGASTQVRSADGRSRRPFYVYDSWRYFFTRRYSRGYAVITALLMSCAAVVHIGVATLRRKPIGLPKAFLSDHWRYVLRPLLSRSQDD